MSRFYLTGTNSRRNEISAAGHSTGQRCHLRGWRSGVEVVASPDGDQDWFDVYMTTGSGGYGHRVLLGAVVEGKNGPKFQKARR